MNKYIFLVLFSFQTVCAAELVLNQETEDQINAALASDGRATVIVGLVELDATNTLSDSAVKCIKSQFLSSSQVIKSLSSQSITVVDELDNLPFVVINLDAEGLDELKRHPEVVSIEADMPIKLQ